MKAIKKKLILFLSILTTTLFISCSDDDATPIEDQGPKPTGNSKTYTLGSVAIEAISGTATFTELDDNSITVALNLQNTPSGGVHPAHIHINTAAESGGIAISLTPVDGTTGKSSTNFNTKDDNTAISYGDLLDFDGHINVHLSATELSTLVAQGDIGQNELTGNSTSYDLGSVAVATISGTAAFHERKNGEALAIIELQNTPAGGEHPGHIHMNTAAEGGGIAFTFNPVNGDTGLSKTNVSNLDDGNSFEYNDVLDYNGYINIHLSATELSTLVAQGDIGQNELTGNSTSYDLGSVAVATISGTAAFHERKNGEALAIIELQNTPAGGEHPGHIHMNTAAEGGGIAFTFNPVNGDTGLSKTNVSNLDDGNSFEYNDVLDYNGYINIHLSATELSTLVAQGDIGQNELTGTTKSYTLEAKDVVGIGGEAEFAERANGTTLVTLTLTGTPDGGSHPAHIHENDAATGGNIIAGLNPVNGTTGISKTQISTLVGGDAVSYDDFLNIDAYINVHLSGTDLATIVALVNIGANDGDTTATTTNYDVTNSGASAYIFNDSGFNNENNPNLTLKRGETYTFSVNTPGHPFLINSVQGTGTGNTYNNGVTNNGAVSGTITFIVPSDAPDTLFYNCEFHGSMTGTITITD